PVGQGRPFELAERVETLHEDLQPVPDLLQRVRRPLAFRISRWPIALIGIAPRMPRQEGDLRWPEAVAEDLKQREVLQRKGTDLCFTALQLFFFAGGYEFGGDLGVQHR